MTLAEYYQDVRVQARLEEFTRCLSDQPTAVYIATPEPAPQPRPVQSMASFLAHGSEIARSLWDRRVLIAHLDIEYVNFDRPQAAFANPAYIFALQQPVVRAVQQVLLDYGIAPLHLLSGRGHHFLWCVRRDSECLIRLARLGRLSPRLEQLYREPRGPGGEAVTPQLGAAHSGLGLVMEYLAHRVLSRAAPRCPIPICLTAVEVGSRGGMGREIISLDLSEYGDPLNWRTIRIPFGAYLKPGKLDEPLNGVGPPLVALPLHELDPSQACGMARELDRAADLAGTASVQIPDQSGPTMHLVDAYRGSALAGFHDWFYSQPHRPGNGGSPAPVHRLPPCCRLLLEHPNDLLLKPAAIQLLTRAMLALGWHPRHIAGLLLSSYEEDHGWLQGLHFYEPACRADFYVRLFSGLVAMGLDEMIDMNCRSNKDKGYCPHPDCRSDLLIPLRDSALARKRTWRLGSPPLDRLL